MVRKSFKGGGANKDDGGLNTSEILSESVINILKEHCGVGVTVDPSLKRRRGPKVPAGKRITNLPVKENQLPSTSKASSSKSKGSSSKRKAADVWICNVCGDEWDDEEGDRWIFCDLCDERFHLQCCGLDYEEEDYCDLDISVITFLCNKCL